MATIIGRRREQADLQEYCRSHKAELICVYGRRRVGKTFLIENTFANQLAFSATGSEDRRASTQLKVFCRALAKAGDGDTRSIRDWFDAFDHLQLLLESPHVICGTAGRRVVFLDEFPWLAGKRSDFLVAFADFWNSWASKQDDIMVILCGSATSWIIKHLFENTGSMYNRITRRLYVAPFTLNEVAQMVSAMGLGWSHTTTLQAYLIFGGLPYYLDMLDRRLSLTQNVNVLCLGPHAPLRDEVPRLMEATLSDSPLHRTILSELAAHKKGIHRTELARRVGDNGSTLKNALDDLEKCGYIRRYQNPYERYHPTIYQLIDPFLCFSLRFMGDDALEDWGAFEGSPSYYAWRGNAFELACLAHIPQIKRALGIAAVETQCFPWESVTTHPGAQVDLAIERKDGVTDLCEMKFSDKPFVATRSFIDDMQHKRSVFREESGTQNAVHLALISATGVALDDNHASVWGELSAYVSGDDLFAF